MTLINVDSTIHDRELITAARAAKLLGVKRETLYAYASRGLLRRIGREGRRAGGYLLADVLRLRARAGARSGHAAVASGALRWGEPVLETSIVELGAAGPVYRGHAAVDLARAGVSFERAAELLWTGTLPASVPPWRPRAPPPKARALASLAAHAPIPVKLQLLVTAIAAHEPALHGATDEVELARARSLVARMACLLGDEGGSSIATTFARSVGLGPRHAARAFDTALVLAADHELNASSFAARIAAGAGCDLHACVAAALATASGTKHGGECDRVEALLREASSRGPRVVQERAARGELVPGFGHALYPAGDPRAPPLIELARSISKKATAPIDAVIDAAREALGLGPTIDTGLVALCTALGAPAGTAVGLFVLGRSAGWVAHALEQRSAGYLLRPRARYVAAPERK